MTKEQQIALLINAINSSTKRYLSDVKMVVDESIWTFDEVKQLKSQLLKLLTN